MSNKLYSTPYLDIKVNLNGDSFCVDNYYNHLHKAYFNLCHTIPMECVILYILKLLKVVYNLELPV